MQALAFKTGLSIRAVHDIVDDLEERGYITREKTGRANRYQVNLEKPMRHGMEKKVSVGSLVQALNTRIRNYGGGSKIDRIVVAVKSKNES
jgi:DNA-binding Lrp family transcriptional regulator